MKRGFIEGKCHIKLIKLIDLTDKINCYWLGFLLADGHISKSNNIQVNLSFKDKEYFQNIEEHLNIELKPSYSKKTNSVRFSLNDVYTVKKISEIFNWKTNKTKNIPIIPKLNSECIFSLVIGFIDGDGSINKNGKQLRIKCDKNWKNILEYFHYILTGKHKIFNLTSDNCSEIIFQVHIC